MRYAFRGTALLFLLLGNTPPDQTPTDIIVTAPARAPKELKKQTVNFVRTVSDTAEQIQFSRRDDPFCVKIVGIDIAYHDVIRKKIRETAKVARAPKEAPEGCRPNIHVIFSNDGDALMQALKRKYPAIVSAQPTRKIDELMQSKKPVRWWYATKIEGANGEPVIDGRVYRYTSSLISSSIEIDLTSTVIIVDINQSNGYPLESVASYISMVAFAQINGATQEATSSTSILGMFSDTRPRIAALRNLTVWDRAYLHALYQIAPDRPMWQQRKRLSAAMAEYIREN
jgi:hypothetical protein